MSFRIKDPIFSPQGNPGKLVGWDSSGQKLIVDQDRKSVQNSFRHGYVKGLSVDMRTEFNDLMDQVGREKGASEKVELLQNKIRELENIPDKSALIFLQYIKSELAHVMHLTGYTPRNYEIDVTRVP